MRRLMVRWSMGCALVVGGCAAPGLVTFNDGERIAMTADPWVQPADLQPKADALCAINGRKAVYVTRQPMGPLGWSGGISTTFRCVAP